MQSVMNLLMMSADISRCWRKQPITHFILIQDIGVIGLIIVLSSTVCQDSQCEMIHELIQYIL